MDSNLVKIVNTVFDEMIATRHSKYKWWLRALRYAPLPGNYSEERKALMLMFYAAMRAIDDYVDGDRQIPGNLTPIAYVQRKLEFLRTGSKPLDEIELLIHYSINIGEILSVDVRKGGYDIVSSLLWDAQRRENFLNTGQLQAYPEKELHHHFDLLDIRGTIPWTLRIFGEDLEKYMYLENLGLAARKYYNLRDFEDDLKAGFVNISLEDCQRLCIDLNALQSQHHPAIRQWFIEQAQSGIFLIADHRRNLPQAHLRWFGRLALFVMYEQSAQRYFRKVLNA